MPSKIAARRSAIHGNGVFATAAIKKGERVVEYKGRRRTHEEVDAGDTGDVDSGHTFLFTLNDEYVIDANHKGNKARWINHSCDPNCFADEQDGRIFITALRNIKAGDELNYDYGLIIEERYTPKLKAEYPCWCGAATCRGTLLAPKRGWRPPMPDLPPPEPRATRSKAKNPKATEATKGGKA